MFDNTSATKYTLTEPQFARAVNLSLSVIRQLRKQGRLSHLRVNKRVLYTKHDVEAFIRSMQREAEAA
jgi:hypothetical protein